MTKKDLQTVITVLTRIKNPTPEVEIAIAAVKRDIAIYDKRRGSWRENISRDEGYYL